VSVILILFVEVNMGIYLQSTSFLALHSSQVNQENCK